MKLSRSELKQQAREQLGNQIFGEIWLFAVLVELIYATIISVTSSFVIGILAIGPLTYGYAKLYLKLAREGGKMDIVGLFDGLKEDLSGNVLLGLLYTIFVALWSLLFVIPGIIKAYAWSMAFYVKNDHPEFGWKQCLDESARITKGHKWELFVLDLSFIGWIFVGSLVFGVGTLWVSAYMNATKANYYERLRDAA